MPMSNGPDVVHLQHLIRDMERTGRLLLAVKLVPYLLEMMGYTPGSHVLAAVMGMWLRVDPLRIVYPLAALFVAMKAGILYEMARRLLAPGARGTLQAAAAPVLALVPAAYFLGSFVQFFFFAQVLSETFAAGLVLAALVWIDSGRPLDLVIPAGCG